MGAAAKRYALRKTLLYGASSLLFYALLALYAADLLSYTAQGGWYFVIPVAIAFLFSFIHGAFTGYFWDALGIKAK